MSKIIRFHEIGGPEVLRIEDLPLAEPGEGEIRLKVEAFSLNRADIMFREDRYLRTPQFPSRLGYEAAGVVDAVGPGTNGIQLGDRVSTIPAFSMGKYGVYGESAIVPYRAVAPYPDNLTSAQGASIWMQYLTAFGALIDIGQLKKGENVLITAAASTTGLAAIQVAKAAGAIVIATVRKIEKKRILHNVGADYVLVTGEEDLVERVMNISSGKGADLIFDPIGGPLLETLADAAASSAIIFEYGALSPEPTIYPLFASLKKGLTVRGYTLFEIVDDIERLAHGKQYIYDGLQSGALKPIIDRCFPMDAIAEAHRYMESNQQTGKIVVIV